MHTDILTSKQARILALLDKMALLQSFYLAGGTALAIQYGHRQSIDFDFYTEKPFEPEDVFDQLSQHGKTRLNYRNPNTLGVYFNDVTCSFFLYNYPIIEDFLIFGTQTRVSSVADIAAMKVAAISGRGKKRDFIDLYCVCQKEMSLGEALKLYQKKYQTLDQDFYHIYKSLVYFEDADSDEMPKMFQPIRWDEVKQFFEREVNRLMDSN